MICKYKHPLQSVPVGTVITDPKLLPLHPGVYLESNWDKSHNTRTVSYKGLIYFWEKRDDHDRFEARIMVPKEVTYTRVDESIPAHLLTSREYRNALNKIIKWR